MSNVRALVALSAVVVLLSNCARKKEAPPRGNVIGSATLSSFQADEWKRDYNYSSDDYCWQLVRLNDGSNVVEMSEGKCSGLSSSPLLTLKLYADITKEANTHSFLVAGSSKTLSENVPVASIFNDSLASPNSYIISDVCDGVYRRVSMNNSCSVEFTPQGKLSGLVIKASMSMNQLVQAGIVLQYETAEQIEDDIDKVEATAAQIKKDFSTHVEEVNNRLALVNTAISGLETRIGTAGEKATGLKKEIQAIEENLVGLAKRQQQQSRSLERFTDKSDKAIAKYTKEAMETQEKIDAAQTALTLLKKTWTELNKDELVKTIGEIQKSLETLKETRENLKLGELKEEIKTIMGSLDALTKARDEAKLGALGKSISDIATSLTALSSDLAALQKKIEAAKVKNSSDDLNALGKLVEGVQSKINQAKISAKEVEIDTITTITIPALKAMREEQAKRQEDEQVAGTDGMIELAQKRIEALKGEIQALMPQPKN